MPGLVGLTLGHDDGRRSVEKMQELIVHLPFHVRDQIFCSQELCCSRVHTGIVQTDPQPGVTGEVRVWLDGEFYNSADLALLLPDVPGPLADAELLGELYSRYRDLQFLAQIDGIYSAVVFDPARRMVRLITDRYGLRHLYWTVHNHDLAWSSEPKAFLELRDFTPRITRDAVNEFFEFGYLLGNRAWFQGVQLLAPGSLLEFDLQTRTHRERRYWSWDSIKPLVSVKEEDALRELATLFSQAVTRHAKAPVTVGVSLSGGLDSRALLAAFPNKGCSIDVVTFGKKGCDDIRIAAQVARVKGAAHHVVELNEDNWFEQRVGGVWLTDGQNDLGHMHALVSMREQMAHYQINLNGYLGDAVLGGWYQDDPTWSLSEMIDNRGRRFINEGTRLANNYLHNRLPFFDNRLLEFTYALPEHLKARSRLYCRMLLTTYPELFKSIPWQKTGVPISRPHWWSSTTHYSKRLASKLGRESARFGLKFSGTRDYSRYPEWMRRGDARACFESVLMSRNALHPQFTSADRVRRLWRQHLDGADRSSELFRALTFEFWLQQVFEERYRAGFAEPEARSALAISGPANAPETRYASD